jgi:hypothetical protein
MGSLAEHEVRLSEPQASAMGEIRRQGDNDMWPMAAELFHVSARHWAEAIAEAPAIALRSEQGIRAGEYVLGIAQRLGRPEEVAARSEPGATAAVVGSREIDSRAAV